MLKIKELTSGYGHVTALKDIDIEVREGEIVTVIGANGSGKSTLLKTAAGLIKPVAGQIMFNGRDITGRPAEQIVASGLCLIPEGRQLFGEMSVKENLEMGGYTALRKRRRGDFNKTLVFVYEMFPILRDRANQAAGTLSGGEQQMLAVGRALMSEPKLLMLDEPSMGLAPKVIKTIFGAIKTLNDNGLTILLVEQDATISLSMADRGYVFQTGRCVMEGAGRDLLDDPSVKEIYFGKQIS
jgi:branched-chain amino acid transport system ATP-binding protein